jgi:hypothetical protein
MNGIENRELYYFMNNIFFMGEFTFNNSSDATHDKLLAMLASKYNIDKSGAKETFYIRDNEESLIYFDDNGFSTSIQYTNLRKSYVYDVWNAYFKNVVRKDADALFRVNNNVIFAKL